MPSQRQRPLPGNETSGTGQGRVPLGFREWVRRHRSNEEARIILERVDAFREGTLDTSPEHREVINNVITECGRPAWEIANAFAAAVPTTPSTTPATPAADNSSAPATPQL